MVVFEEIVELVFALVVFWVMAACAFGGWVFEIPALAWNALKEQLLKNRN